jgi:hypothetical protein
MPCVSRVRSPPHASTHAHTHRSTSRFAAVGRSRSRCNECSRCDHTRSLRVESDVRTRVREQTGTTRGRIGYVPCTAGRARISLAAAGRTTGLCAGDGLTSHTGYRHHRSRLPLLTRCVNTAAGQDFMTVLPPHRTAPPRGWRTNAPRTAGEATQSTQVSSLAPRVSLAPTVHSTERRSIHPQCSSTTSPPVHCGTLHISRVVSVCPHAALRRCHTADVISTAGGVSHSIRSIDVSCIWSETPAAFGTSPCD